MSNLTQSKSFPAALHERLHHGHIPALDGIRAIAVTLVILYHLGLAYVPGGHGVTMFFVLSGFLITWLLLDESARHGSISLGAFYRRRALRIMPAFYAYWIFLIGLLLVASKPILWPHAISALFFVSNYYNAILGDPNNALSHTWSLAIEEQFYLLWPFVLIAFQRKLRAASYFLVGVIACVWVYRLVLYFVFHVDQGYFYAAFETRMDALMVGCLIAVLLKRQALGTAWKMLCCSPFMLLVPIGLFILSLYFSRMIPRYRDTIGLAVDPVLIGLWMVQMVNFSSSGFLSWIESPLVRLIGKLSYSMYLYQQLTADFVHRKLENLPMVLQIVAVMVSTIAVAYLSYRFIEKPFLKLKYRTNKTAASPTGEIVSR